MTPIVLLVVPVWPFFPRCVDEKHHYRHIFRYMSPEYRHMLTALFNDFGVYYWDIGGIVLIRALPFLDGKPLFNHYDGIANAEDRAAHAVANPNFIITLVGIQVDGRVYRIPPFIRDLVKNNPGDDPYTSCDVMPYIVTMTPPP